MNRTSLFALVAVATAASIVLLSGCDKKQTLYVYNWAEYIDPEAITQFEQENNCNVSIDSFDSNEAMLAKLLAGASGYDVVFPTSYIVNSMKKHGLLSKIDKTKLPNVIANFDKNYERFLENKDFEWSVPYAFGITGIAWRNDKVDFPTNLSWNVLANSNFHRICLLDDIREMIGLGLKVNGFSVNSTNVVEHEKALNTILEWKKNALKLDNVQYRNELVNAQIYVSIGYNSDILQVRDEIPDVPIGFQIPVEGSTCCFDEIVILKNGNLELAHKFIDFMYKPEIAAQNCKYICSAIPNSGMKELLDSEYLDNELMFPTKEILDKLEMTLDIGDGIKLWNETWDKFKSNK